MQIGVRKRSYKKSITSMTTGRLKRSVKRQLIPGYGKKGMGWITNPKKAAYNRVYSRTTVRSPLPYFSPSKTHSTTRRQAATPHRVPATSTVNVNLAETIATSSKALTVTSNNFEQLKQDLTDVYENRAALRKQLAGAQANYYLTFLFSSSKKRQAKRHTIEHAYIDLTFRKDLKDSGSWDEATYYFQELMQSNKVWDLVSRQATDKFHQRTVADESVDRKPITKRDHKTLEFIKADADNLYLPNLNGADLYIYPTFIVLFKNYKQFSIHDLRQVNIAATSRSFHEEEGVPSDTQTIGQTYKYTNKNGEPDRRFSNNYAIPVVRYGDLRYMFSNHEKFAEFGKALAQHAKSNLQAAVR